MQSFYRYLLTGVTAAFADFGIFFLTYRSLLHFEAQAGYPEQWANAAGMITGFVLSFLLNRQWSFQSRGPIGSQFLRALLLLACNTLVGGWILTVCMQLGLSAYACKIGLQTVLVFWNFWAYKHLIYTHEPGL